MLTTMRRGPGRAAAGAPNGSTDEPLYDAGLHTMVYSDDIDDYVNIATMDALACNTEHFVPTHSNCMSSEAVPAGEQLVTGRGGSGLALRLEYEPDGSQQSLGFNTINTTAVAANVPTYWSYWARIGADGPIPTLNFQVKWFFGLHPGVSGGDRIQYSIQSARLSSTPSYSAKKCYWQIYDADGPAGNTVHGNQPRGPYFEDLVNDGLWHRFTHSYLCNSSGVWLGTTSRDGYARMWIDGTKIIDVSQATVDVEVEGADGMRPWCDQADVDAIKVNIGIQGTERAVQFGSVYTGPAMDPWRVDFDDIQFYRET